MGVSVGRDVGYQVRFDSCTSADTVLKYVTDGTLLRECLDSPTALLKYSVVVLDEAHVRSLETDILFGLVRVLVHDAKKLKSRIPKIIVMSATLHAAKFAEFFECTTFTIPGNLYPVQLLFNSYITPDNYHNTSFASRAIDVVMQLHEHKPAGDILVFLTGRDEIERACDELFRRSEKLDYRYDISDRGVTGLLILPIYGALTSEMQQRIFQDPPKKVRKVIISTDIASTSLTIDGIVYVVDSGFVKQKMFNPKTGLDGLHVTPISRSEAQQRAGRAGRTRPGECHRLYDEDFWVSYCCLVLELHFLTISNLHQGQCYGRAHRTRNPAYVPDGGSSDTEVARHF